MSDEPSTRRDRRVILLLVLGLALLFGGLYVAGYYLSTDRVPRGTTVAGVEIGGMTPAAARQELSRSLARRDQGQVALTGDDRTLDVARADLGVSVDVAASVDQAGAGRSWSPVRMWEYLTGGGDQEAVVLVDQAAFDELVADAGEELASPARDGNVRFVGGAVRTRPPEDGTTVDEAALAQAVGEAYTSGADTLEVPLVEDEPEIAARDVSRALNRFANPAVSAPVTIELAGESLQLRPEVFARALSMVPRDGRLVPELDGERLMQLVEPRFKTVGRKPKDATVRLVDGRPEVVPAKNGVTYKARQITGRFLDVVADTDDRTLRVKSVVDPPAFTTKDARGLGVDEQVSQFTTYFPYAEYRNVNLGRAAELVNGTLLKPGDVFSLNGIVGERTKANGFTKGFIISDGIYAEDYGGGVSQVATTTFNAAFFAGLEDVTHTPHSFYIDRYPVGREATVAWPSVDLKFRNDTPHGVLVQAWVDPSTPTTQGAMHVRMWSTKTWTIKTRVSDRYNLTSPATRRLSGDECVPNDGYGGFDVDVFRYFYKPGSSKLDHKEKLHTTYTPSDTVICS